VLPDVIFVNKKKKKENNPEEHRKFIAFFLPLFTQYGRTSHGYWIVHIIVRKCIREKNTAPEQLVMSSLAHIGCNKKS